MYLAAFLEKNKPGGRSYCVDNAYLAAFGEKIDWVGGIVGEVMCV